MHILVLQETDWLRRGPHPQHHIFERLSTNSKIKVTVIDYDIDNIQKSNSLFVNEKKFNNISRTVKNSNITIFRTAHLKIPFLRRITSLFTNFIKTLKIFQNEKPDLIVAYSMTNGWIGLIFSKLFSIPFVFHYIDILHELVPIPYLKKIAQINSMFLLRFSDLIFALTKIHQNYLLNLNIALEKVKILSNGVSLENTNIDNEKLLDLKQNLSISEDDFILFFMGYLYSFAGLIEIIERYNSEIKEGRYKLKFLILGDGGIHHELKKKVQDLGANWVLLAGRIPFQEITEYIALADLCLLSFEKNDITKEIMPIKIYEYMAMKKPVLCNSLPGVLSEIGHNNGVIFAKDQKTLIDRIGKLIEKKEYLKQVGVKGYNFVTAYKTWKIIITDFKRKINELLDGVHRDKNG
ncbi:MAG: glycosyltransferase [Promethearchaeia archaeon]